MDSRLLRLIQDSKVKSLSLGKSSQHVGLVQKSLSPALLYSTCPQGRIQSAEQVGGDANCDTLH